MFPALQFVATCTLHHLSQREKPNCCVSWAGKR